VVENPGLWNWTFTLKDADGEVLAQIDRDWRGFGFEVEFLHSVFYFIYKYKELLLLFSFFNIIASCSLLLFSSAIVIFFLNIQNKFSLSKFVTALSGFPLFCSPKLIQIC